LLLRSCLWKKTQKNNILSNIPPLHWQITMNIAYNSCGDICLDPIQNYVGEYTITNGVHVINDQFMTFSFAIQKDKTSATWAPLPPHNYVRLFCYLSHQFLSTKNDPIGGIMGEFNEA
jgi:hypothetical protein